MKKNAFILFTSVLLLGLNQGDAGWLYEPDQANEIAYEEEVDLSQTLGKIVEEEIDNDTITYHDEELLPWGIHDSKHEELSSFVEEHAKEAFQDYEENFAFDSQAEDFEEEGNYPTMERVPSRSTNFIAGRPKVVESNRKQKEVVHGEKMGKKRVTVKKPVTKRRSQTAQGPLKKKSQIPAKQPKKSIVRKDRKTPSKSEVSQKKKRSVKQKKAAVVNRQKRQRPRERLAQNEE